MIAPPQIVQTTTQLTALIHLTLAREEMPKVFGACVGELLAAIQAQAIAPAVTGPHSEPDPARWRTELNRPLVG